MKALGSFVPRRQLRHCCTAWCTPSFRKISCPTAARITCFTTSRYKHTKGDAKLAHFLRDEINKEEAELGSVVVGALRVDNFDMKVEDGTKVSLTRLLGEERIVVTYDVTQSDDENKNMVDEYTHGDPVVSISIQKQSGTRLLFACECQQYDDDVDDDDCLENLDNVEDDIDNDLIKILNVQVYDTVHSSVDPWYSDTHNMDVELYSMLLHTLMERGITGKFVNNFLSLATRLHRQRNLLFLKQLEEFVKEK